MTREPSSMPLAGDDESDFSQYSVTGMIQTAGTDIDSATAAASMALMGCGANSQIDVKSKLNSDTSTNITIHKITNLLKKKKTDVNGFSYRTMAFTPKNNTIFKEDDLIDCLSYALAYDTVPVIRVDKTSLLPYYNTDMNYPLYLAVTEVDHQAECIRFYDPNNNSAYSGKHYLDFIAVRNLLVGSKVLWVSAFASDKRLIGLEGVKNVYPNGSYYNSRTDGKACTCHSWCKPGKTYNNGEYCTCYRIDDGTQCVAFARFVFESVKGRNEKESQNNSLYYHPVGQTVYNNPGSAKTILNGLSVGTYVRVQTTTWDSRNEEYVDHSLSIVDTSDTHITVYQANYGGGCLVTYKPYTWAEFVENFRYIYFYVE